MSSIRILSNNIADNATLSASNTSGGLVINNTKTESKSEIHRSTGTSVSYTLNWASNQIVNCVALPCTNLSATATIRVRLYDSTPALLYDSGTVTAVPGYNLSLNGSVHNVNLFSYGFISKSAIWAPSLHTTVRQCVIDLVDTSSVAGYIDCSRILCGEYWGSQFGVENGFQYQIVDGSNVTRNNAGELVCDVGFINDKINFNFALIPETDRAKLVSIFRKIGVFKNFFVSVLPDYSDPKAEQDMMIYGKRSNSSITYRLFDFYNSSMEITSW